MIQNWPKGHPDHRACLSRQSADLRGWKELEPRAPNIDTRLGGIVSSFVLLLVWRLEEYSNDGRFPFPFLLSGQSDARRNRPRMTYELNP